jgi:inner membrane protein
VTQGLLGASFGQALYGRRLGKPAILWGAFMGMLPDVDTALNLTGPLGEFVWHRSFTHSLWFGPVVGPLLGLLLWRWRSDPEETRAAWMGLGVVALVTHPLLDWFTSYGTQLLHPFSRHRFALDAVAIVDPAYSVVLVLGLLVGAWRGFATGASQWAGALALALSTAYLCYGYALNERLKGEVRAALAAEGVPRARVEAYPTLLQTHLRRVVVRAGHETRVGFVSTWTGRGTWESFHEPQDPRIAAARDTPEGRLLEWFAMGVTTGRVPPREGGSAVEIDDLRYGFPSRPRQGLWGLRFELDAQGRPLPGASRYNRPLPAPAGDLLREVFQRAYSASPS